VWFDSHCHLHLCESARPDQIVEAASAAGVDAMLTVGIDVSSSREAVALASDQRVFAAVGLHPNAAEEWNDEVELTLRELLARDRVVAVGESGLDFYRDSASADAQQRAFTRHIVLAKEMAKALVIHTRDSLDAALDVLEKEAPPERFVFHCWSGDRRQLTRALELGAYVSFAGNVSFKSAQNLRDAAGVVPEERLLVETDAPYLTPVPFRGRPNEPSRVVLVGEAVAGARGTDAGAVARLTASNARRLLALA
jgi:TatD DNase family protein